MASKTEKQEKIERRAFLAAQLEEARKDLRKPGPKLPITMYDYFVLGVIVANMIRPDIIYPWWVYSIVVLFWERPRLLYRQFLYRMQVDKELRASIKLMESEMKNIKDE